MSGYHQFRAPLRERIERAHDKLAGPVGALSLALQRRSITKTMALKWITQIDEALVLLREIQEEIE